ncbi:polyprenyl diphosphate synthase [Clostridium botulinum]|uniref:Di-trans,poly-cis-decaprenylcistransferase n=2 Tax=Clostridium botulinum TaxID=1491 RepID=A0A846HZP8_CLOBO|nr:polyprenyl diphosphate synthase [Clostridium botulinum]AJD28548.1 di-trans,poly-cis-decaprenylcistransferase [Clostridium botulinum CDC_297]EPS53081.1 UDP pyrophosphate synthetase [Clostridium botulinum A1 str. CFSAN002368]ACQ54900.1 putative undecaprenyl pyrophosphate synthetase [Clostridium botulinum Ba4 str. 657]AJE11805.1 di-trans,poly-cis-decaprenylcistransferase [Clostridium botulinum CDC_1436]APR00217.1 di-trans,poly-cis-decaprenylcistransferase [Clostridium botulinum]
MRVPNHIGIIPDGNRRWANNKGMEKQCGYKFGLNPGLILFRLCKAVGINEITYYGFTTDNNKRPKVQRESFTKACVEAVEMLCNEDASLLVVGNTESSMFPKELLPYTKERKVFKKGGIKVNFLVNYGWEWDLQALENNKLSSRNKINKHIKSTDISRVDLIIRWGGRRRLSGFLPIQSVYSDFYIIEDYWPDFKSEHLYEALKWYDKQDITLGG